jgi:hypothetical protein
MEGIQHRWDCPGRTNPDAVTLMSVTYPGYTRTHCTSCGRAAISTQPKPEEKPDER